MIISFQARNITGPQMAARLRAAISEEGVGWEADFHSRAILWECDPSLEKYIQTWGGRSSVTTDDRPNLAGLATQCGQPIVWETARSGFAYTLLNATSKRGTPALIQYEGAEKGFLSQDLLPDELRQEVRITEVKGTYGSFRGEDAFAQYQAQKRAWEEATERVHDALEIVGVFSHNGWKRPFWTASIFAMTQDPDWGFWDLDQDEVDRVQEHPIIVRTRVRLNDHLRRGLFCPGQVSKKQFAQLVLQLREFQNLYRVIDL